MEIRDLEHKVEAMENAADRNLNTNTLLAFMVPALWQISLQVAKLTEAVEKARG